MRLLHGVDELLGQNRSLPSRCSCSRISAHSSV